MPNRSEAIFQGFKSALLPLRQTLAIVEADVRKLIHDPFELFTRMIQPSIWLLIFGQAMTRLKTTPTAGLPYLDFIAPGILAQSVLFISIFYGISLIWERDMGVLHKVMATPAPRFCLVLGRALAAGLRGLSQIFIIYFLAYLSNVNLRLEPMAFLGVILMVILSAAVFSTLSLIVASIVKKRERFMGIGQVLTMPLFFASNALYPIDLMPDWIRALSIINPLTYQVDALRSLMVAGEASHFGLPLDFTFGLIFFILLAGVATKVYPKILY